MQLPDLLLSVPLPDGSRWTTQFRDVRIAEFFDAFPEPGRSGDDWAIGLLARASVRPRLSRELVARLGPVLRGVLAEYLCLLGWTDRAADAPPPRFASERTRPTLDVALVARVPSGTPRRIIRLLVERIHVAPHALWTRWTVSEFATSWRTIFDRVDNEETDELARVIGFERQER